MAINFDELLKLLIELSNIKNLRASAYDSAKAGIVTGLSTFVGGLVLGRIGLLLGASVGGAASILSCKNAQPVAVILRDLPVAKKKALLDTFVNAFRNVGFEDVVTLSALVLKNQSVQTMAIQTLGDFLRNEMNLRIQC